jgi:ribosomal protein L16 Arg81 hydroxylase
MTTTPRHRVVVLSGQTPDPAPQSSALAPSALPSLWQAWLQENHTLGVPDAQLIEIMLQEGVASHLATQAVQALSQQRAALAALPLAPGWWEWIQTNQARQVPDAVLIQTLVQHEVPEAIATQAVQLSAQRKPQPVAQPPKSVEAQILAKLESLLAIQRQLAALSPQAGQIERRDRLSQQEFLERYYSTNTPVILTGMMQDWPALHTWCPDYLKQHYGHAQVEIQAGRNADPNYEINTNQHKKTVQLKDYVDLVVNGGKTNDYYLVANNGNLEREDLKGLLQDIVMPDFLNPQDISQRVFFWFGPAGTITPLHHDPLNLMMAHMVGRKRWRLISPSSTPLLYNHVGVFSQVDLENPDPEKYPLFAQAPVMEAVLEPGEIIFIPVGWWHQVKALDISLSVSFTNFRFPNAYDIQNPQISASQWAAAQTSAQGVPLQRDRPLLAPATPASSPGNPSPPRADTPLRTADVELTYDAVKTNVVDGYLVDRITPQELLVISFGFVAWDGVPGFDFYGRTKKIERLTQQPINRILLRDFANAWYHRGVRGLGDSIDAVADRLRDLIQQIAPSRIVTVGQSMGAYAAILYGQLLGVDQVLAFGSLAFLNSQRALEIGDRRWLSILQDLETNPPQQSYFDLTDPQLRTNTRTKIDLFYGQKPDPDTPGPLNLDDYHAQQLATLPYLTLHPYADAGHAIVQYLIDQRRIDALLLDGLMGSAD